MRGRTESRDLIGGRPAWHRLVGYASVLVGLAVVALNDLTYVVPGTALLPGGHSEFYLMGGAIVAASSLWWFGWMDSTQ